MELGTVPFRQQLSERDSPLRRALPPAQFCGVEDWTRGESNPCRRGTQSCYVTTTGPAFDESGTLGNQSAALFYGTQVARVQNRSKARVYRVTRRLFTPRKRVFPHSGSRNDTQVDFICASEFARQIPPRNPRTASASPLRWPSRLGLWNRRKATLARPFLRLVPEASQRSAGGNSADSVRQAVPPRSGVGGLFSMTPGNPQGFQKRQRLLVPKDR